MKQGSPIRPLAGRFTTKTAKWTKGTKSWRRKQGVFLALSFVFLCPFCDFCGESSSPGTDYSDNATVRMDADNEPQPAVLLWIDEALGGQSRNSEDDYIEGAPELIVEIASSSASYDLNEKLHVYRRNGVCEYIVWQVYHSRIDWFVLENEKYGLLQPDKDGMARSRVFPGLWLDADAMLKGDMAKVLSILQQGLTSSEHGEFIKRLSEAVKKK
jgi:Putative restriction endonuclease